VTGVNKCALCDLFDKLGGKDRVTGAAYNAALHELCGTTGDWSKRPQDLRSMVVHWTEKKPKMKDGYPRALQVDGGVGTPFFAVPLEVQLATVSAMVVAERSKTEAARAELSSTEADLKSAREVGAGGACTLGKRPVYCNDGRMHDCWPPETKDLLAGIQAEHTISATATGKIAGRVLQTMEAHAGLAKMLLGGSTERVGEAGGRRDLCTRALIMTAMNARMELARLLLPVLGAGGGGGGGSGGGGGGGCGGGGGGGGGGGERSGRGGGSDGRGERTRRSWCSC
jgi:hypothetical protein